MRRVRTYGGIRCRASLIRIVIVVFNYKTKKKLRASIGLPLKVIGDVVITDGVVVGYNKPWLTGFNCEFFAQVTVVNGLIAKVK